MLNDRYLLPCTLEYNIIPIRIDCDSILLKDVHLAFVQCLYLYRLFQWINMPFLHHNALLYHRLSHTLPYGFMLSHGHLLDYKGLNRIVIALSLGHHFLLLLQYLLDLLSITTLVKYDNVLNHCWFAFFFILTHQLSIALQISVLWTVIIMCGLRWVLSRFLDVHNLSLYSFLTTCV